MNWIKKTVVFIGLSIVLLFAFSANQSPIEKIKIEKTSSSFSPDSIHSSVFIQPHANNIVGFHYKTTDYTIAKYLENFQVAISDFKVLKFFSRHAKQDINRCEMVSLLLFPFHYFW
jgi:hypothetical protein